MSETKTMPIYFSDLNERAQKALLEFVNVKTAKEANWDVDVFPLFYYEVEEEEEKS